MGAGIRSLVTATAALLAAGALGAPTAANAQGAGSPLVCPGTFEVLHDDSVGQLVLPKGAYTITLLDQTALTCSDATDLLRQFLEDFDGRLPRPWVVNVVADGFTRGSGSSVGFRVAAATGGGGGGGRHPVGAACPGTFQVLHNDRVGTFAIPRGQYQITLLAVGRMSCSKASSYLARFLQDFDGILPRPWLIDRETGSFMRGSRNVGFRIKKLVGPARPSGGGSGIHPSGDRCPGTFQVLDNDSIGSLRLRRGRYRITLLSDRLSCQTASRRFAAFLDDTDGVLPRPWVVKAQTGTFTRGRAGTIGFRIKPAR